MNIIMNEYDIEWIWYWINIIMNKYYNEWI